MLAPAPIRRVVAAALVAVLLAPSPARAASRLTVAAASDLKGTMEALGRAFEASRPDVRVAVTAGASGTLFAQAEHGAPFDLFFSADREYPRRLVEAGVAGPGREVVYAIGRLVVWTPPGSRLELGRLGLRALADPAAGKIAIANPATAPYGRAALAALRSSGLEAAVEGRLVLGQNVAQAAQFAQSGAAGAALVSLSLTSSPALAGGNVYPVPPDAHPPLEQAAVVLRRARDPALAGEFLAWVTGPAGRDVLARHGYALP